MHIQTCTYLTSIPSLKHKHALTPKPEFLFIGRSNVGKSSLINLLAGKKQLARVSGSPGKTNYFNYYNINQSHYWVDLPGYGFAKVSQKQRTAWKQAWHDFLTQNDDIQCIFQLIDARIKLQQNDKEKIHELVLSQKPHAIILTKVEKVKAMHLKHLLQSIQTQLAEVNAPDIPCFSTSATKGIGREEILDYIEQTLLNL